jgi:hypothetical protein
MKLRKILFLSIVSASMTVTLPILGSTDGLAGQVTVCDGVVICDCGIPYQNHIDSIKTSHDKNSTQLKGLECECGGTVEASHATQGRWFRTITSRACTHTAYGHDYQWTRLITVTYNCTDCILSYDTVSHQKEWHCGEK